jgi:hypothetical protein
MNASNKPWLFLQASRRAFLCVCIPLVCLAGCGRDKPDAPPPSSSDKRSAFKRFLSADTMPGYAWDGQFSKATVAVSIEAAYDRALVVLKALDFTVNESESRKQGATAHILAANAAKTVAQLDLQSKAAAEAIIKVKVGTTGDRGGSERILDEIQKGLQPQPAKKAKQ